MQLSQLVNQLLKVSEEAQALKSLRVEYNSYGPSSTKVDGWRVMATLFQGQGVTPKRTPISPEGEFSPIPFIYKGEKDAEEVAKSFCTKQELPETIIRKRDHFVYPNSQV